MEDQSFKIDRMIETLVELASNEVEKAKARNYFSKDLAEACCYVAKMAKGQEEGYGDDGGYGNYNGRGNYGGYGNDRRGYGASHGGYDTHQGYGNEENYREENYGTGANRKGERYGRNGERYG